MRTLKLITKTMYDKRKRLVERECLTYGEVRLLKPWVVVNYSMEGVSILNASLPRTYAFDLFFGPSIEDRRDDEAMNWLASKNLIREFILQRKGYSEKWRDMEIIEDRIAAEEEKSK